MLYCLNFEGNDVDGVRIRDSCVKLLLVVDEAPLVGEIELKAA